MNAPAPYVPRHARRHVPPTPAERIDALVAQARTLARRLARTDGDTL